MVIVPSVGDSESRCCYLLDSLEIHWKGVCFLPRIFLGILKLKDSTHHCFFVNFEGGKSEIFSKSEEKTRRFSKSYQMRHRHAIASAMKGSNEMCTVTIVTIWTWMFPLPWVGA